MLKKDTFRRLQIINLKSIEFTILCLWPLCLPQTQISIGHNWNLLQKSLKWRFDVFLDSSYDFQIFMKVSFCHVFTSIFDIFQIVILAYYIFWFLHLISSLTPLFCHFRWPNKFMVFCHWKCPRLSKYSSTSKCYTCLIFKTVIRWCSRFWPWCQKIYIKPCYAYWAHMG